MRLKGGNPNIYEPNIDGSGNPTGDYYFILGLNDPNVDQENIKEAYHKLEKIYKGVKATLLHNWELLRNADSDTMVQLLSDMIAEFKKDCDKRNAKKLFRIHWDGDFFNDTYAYAWKTVINNNKIGRAHV